jgi:Mitochondrial ribosomal protein (VAR1)
MLNLFNLNSNKKIEKKKINPQEKYNKHHPSAVREWNNSIYVFNKKAINLIPQVTQLAINLIKSYFNLYNSKLERKIRSSRLLGRLRRLSSNKIYVSNGEFKHTNNKVVITLYIFNRQSFNFKKKFIKSYYESWLNQDIFEKRRYTLLKKKQLIEFKVTQSLKKLNEKKILLINTLESYTKNKEILGYKNLSKYLAIFHKKLLRKSLDKTLLYYSYKQLIIINKSKFNYDYLQYLKKYLEKIYNKNVEFNLVNLRRFYLNSDILSESIILKIRKNRRKLLKFLNILKRKVKTHNKKNLYYQPVLKNLNINIDKKSLEKIVLKNIKYKHVTGFRLEASGRLTRRYTASRSISKLRYKGNLLNIDSSYRGLSSVLLKGNLKSNIQYTKLKSKTRIGSFGIKGWVSGN